MRFAVDISRTPLPWSYRRRVGFRNSRRRQENSGFVNYERLWLVGFDVTIEWGGNLNPSKPQWSYRGSKKRVAAQST